MRVSGCDVGSLTAKVVIINNNEIEAKVVLRCVSSPEKSAESVMSQAVSQAGITLSDIDYIVGTGYGKERISFANHTESEINCHAQGVYSLLPEARTVIDIGGQDAKVVKIGDQGQINQYVYNDKCASGTGRFLEVMAEALELPIDMMSLYHEQAKEKLHISNQCVIFAESEVVSLINEGKETPDIICGLNTALAKRVSSLARSIGIVPDVVFTGGVAKNSGVAKALEQSIGLPLTAYPLDPQISGAYGAAVLALKHLSVSKID
ncbi:MAG: CoA-substrate-specific enzyme activase [Candidatus Magnetoglobus multicellularis str. Araruama]|uniref:CoA-substrate-specific enzyme activase n=1 Tax=Candidatus Magnetoglobus multicellularis str. Araruama TaxID=890399 RepID=A0A1V1P468_9BACT|nr:MAG: CoA-substrate-specific enzyme activase [Candidatus Magnetoglobus multicellularis str. Araruama]